MRQQGILMPVFSIPSKYGIGTFGREAFRFVDFLSKSGNRLWQLLPLGQTGCGDSPYQSCSTFAGNPYFIDLELLTEAGYLSQAECEAMDFGSDECVVDYEKVGKARRELLRRAWARAREQGTEQSEEYGIFLQEHAHWLEDYALYMALKEHFGGGCFLEWEEDIRLRREEALGEYRSKLADEISFYEFCQYLFYSQWKPLKQYANERGIQIVGDIPIYVAFDSADTWANPKLFQLNEAGYPLGVAGVPPDYFSETGQLWGNPLYDWNTHRETGYDWWMRRIAHCFELYDVLRIDHFRAFDEYWFVPYGDQDARGGHWEKGPGYAFFEVLEQRLGKRQIIAEDLGLLTDSVLELLHQTGYPGMKVLQFAFAPWQDSSYLPHHHIKNCVVYTGTHDNNTTEGWLAGISQEERTFVEQYLGEEQGDRLCWSMIRTALSSVADTAVVPMQDYLRLGAEARINTPSTVQGNWNWRMNRQALTEELAEKIHQMARMYGRL